MSKLAHSSDYMDEIEFRARIEDGSVDWGLALEAWRAELDGLVALADTCNALPALHKHCYDHCDGEYLNGIPVGNLELKCLAEIDLYRETHGQFGVGA